MAAIYTLNGNELTTGLQGCNACDEAISAAQRHADSRAEPVELVDDDGRWLVYPATSTGRVDADFVCELNSADTEYNTALAQLVERYYDNDQGLRTRA